MFNQGLNVFIQEDYFNRSVNVWVGEFSGIKQFNISYKDGNLIKTEIPECTPFGSNGDEPFLRIPKMFSDQLFKAIADHLSDKGIKTKNDFTIEGELNATKLHLKDMQDITKKLLKIEK